MYLGLMFMVLSFALIGYAKRDMDNLLFHVEMILMTLMVCFRYGQGSDYHAYETVFFEQIHRVDIVYYEHEWLFGYFNKFFSGMGWSFQLFVFLIGLCSMALTVRGIAKLSNIKTLSALLLLPTFYLSYYFSIMREGLVLAIVLGIIIPLILEQKNSIAIILILVMPLIHQSSIIMLAMLPVIFTDIPWYRMRKTMITFAFACGIGMWIFLKYSHINSHNLHFDPSYPALAIRIVMFVLITMLFDRSEKTWELKKMYNIYLIGFCIFLVFFAAALFSNRGTAYFKILEVIMIPQMLGTIKHISVADCRNAMRKTILSFLIFICMVEGMKNLASYPAQLDYSSEISFYNYPYISIFNKEQEKLYYDQ